MHIPTAAILILLLLPICYNLKRIIAHFKNKKK